MRGPQGCTGAIAQVVDCIEGDVCGAISNSCTTCAASSNLLTVRSPDGFSAKTSHATMSGGSSSRHTYGILLGPRKMPPRHHPKASWAPSHAGLPGTISQKCVGRSLRASRSHRQSSSSVRTSGVRTMCPTPLGGSTACRKEKQPMPPGTTRMTLYSSPRSRCHFCANVWRWQGLNSSRAAWTLMARIARRDTVIATVS